MIINEPIRMLSQDEMEKIHANALRILDELGVWIESDQAMDYLEAGGCRVDRETRIVSFPPDVVNKWVAKMRSDFTTRTTPEKMSVRYSHVRFRKEPHHIYHDFSVNTGGFCVFIADFDGKKRRANLEDVRKW